MTTTTNTNTLRAAIEAAMRRRYTNARGVSVVDGATSISTQRAGAVIDEPGIIREVCVLTHISADALRTLARLVGLRDDGSDPAAEVERLTQERDEARASVRELIEEIAEARAALRHYGPKCIVCDRPATRRYFSSPACDDDKHLAAVRSPAADRLGAAAQDTDHAAALRAAGGGR